MKNNDKKVVIYLKRGIFMFMWKSQIEMQLVCGETKRTN
jgi:hypothetical protein